MKTQNEYAKVIAQTIAPKQQQQCEREKQVHERLTALAVLVEDCYKLTTGLEEALVFVSRPKVEDLPRPQQEPVPTPVTAPLALRLELCADVLRNTNETLRGIHSRLEV